MTDLEADDDLQDAMLSVHHAVAHTLSGTGAAKLIENHKGRAWIQMSQVVLVPGPPQGGKSPGVPALGAPPQPQALKPQKTRAQRKKGRRHGR